MRLFDIDGSMHVEGFTQRGWVHVRGGVTGAFLTHMQEVVRRQRMQAVSSTGIRGDIDQFLYEPPPDADLFGELRELTAQMCGLDPDQFVLSERHIKSYANDATPAPTAHKDRLASQVSIGVSIEVPDDSYLELYPDVERDLNPHLAAADLNRSLPQHEHPDVVLPGKPCVEIHDRPGDVIVFPGSSVWHRRRNAANAVNLYLKCNDFGCDPLAEDPSTAARHDATAQATLEPEHAANAVPVLSRRLEWTGRITGRDGITRAVAKVWDAPFTVISEEQLEMLDDLARTPSTRTRDNGEAILDLAARGIVDLVVD